MSLAMYAAPFDNDINIVNNDNTPIGRKRALNKTQKRMPFPKENSHSERVTSVLQTIHNLPDEDEVLADFNPPPLPQSSGVEQTKINENSKPSFTHNSTSFVGQPYQTNIQQNSYNPHPIYPENSIEQFSMVEGKYSGELAPGRVSEDYQRFMPNYNEMYNKNNAPYYGSDSIMSNFSHVTGDKNELLIEKLNYMIKLLEDQQDEKTSNVTEEVILYSFLGIFIIFIVDSFARVGKYVR
jgi:hypothetical protein